MAAAVAVAAGRGGGTPARPACRVNRVSPSFVPARLTRLPNRPRGDPAARRPGGLVALRPGGSAAWSVPAPPMKSTWSVIACQLCQVIRLTL